MDQANLSYTASLRSAKQKYMKNNLLTIHSPKLQRPKTYSNPSYLKKPFLKSMMKFSL